MTPYKPETKKAALERKLKERLDLQERTIEAYMQINDLLSYLTSPKFQGADADYIHIRTDLLPKLQAIKLVLS